MAKETRSFRILSALYAVQIVLGAAFLKLPISHTVPITRSDVIFTSTSAVTVTGLVVIDTGADLTLLGQMVLAFLSQMGGLGLMTFAGLIRAAFGLPVGITGKLYLREHLNHNSMHQLSKLVITILKVVVFCEVAGAMILPLTFIPYHGFWQGIRQSIFHSIVAFNNAGFSTFPNGLVPYATDPAVKTVITALFIVWGHRIGGAA